MYYRPRQALGHSRMSTSRPDFCGGTIALSHRRDVRVAQSRRCTLNRLFPAWSLSPVNSRALAPPFLELADSTVMRVRAPISTHFAPMPNGVWRSCMVLLPTAAPRLGDGLDIFSLLAASARGPAPSISRAMAMLASEKNLEARSLRPCFAFRMFS